ncbi:hypothetical protein FRB95_010123 [Tulasnella sp. JGI-2019a]|nr:hypothetical protein FRB95_010123 [Tulasnella sp. JGI-2019a]
MNNRRGRARRKRSGTTPNMPNRAVSCQGSMIITSGLTFVYTPLPCLNASYLSKPEPVIPSPGAHDSDRKKPGSAQFKSIDSPTLQSSLIKLLHCELLEAMFESNEVPFASSRTAPPLSAIQIISKHARNIPSSQIASYVPICRILNIVLGTTTHSPLFGNNQFIPYNKEMADGVEDAGPLKPDILLLSCPPNASVAARWRDVFCTVEVNGNWAELLDQAATYGRALFHARKTRRYAMVIGINHVKKSLRFIFFHRGGRTLTPSFNLTNPKDVKRFYVILKGLQECRTTFDAGYVTSVAESTPIWASATIIATKTCIRGRGNYVAILRRHDKEARHAVQKTHPSSVIVRRSPRFAKKTSDLPKILKKLELVPPPPEPNYNDRYTPISTSFSEDLEDIVSSFQLASMTFPYGDAVDSIDDIPKHLVVKGGWPRKDKMVEKDMFLRVSGRFGLPKLWGVQETCDNGALLKNVTKHGTSKPASDCELRQHVQLYFGTIGTPFFDIPKTKGAHLALIHAMIGHYILPKSGYLHRDISDSNILGVSETRAWDDDDLAVLQEFGISTSDSMCGMVIDGDLAVSLDEGDVMPTDGEICGTLLFMSNRILQLWFDNAEIIHTPADDLESFVWVGIINALRHVSNPSGVQQRLLDGLLDFDLRIVIPWKGGIAAIYKDGAKHDHFGLLFKWLEVLEQDQWQKVEAGRAREDFYPLYKEMIDIGISYVREQRDLPWEQME